jgi:hypothetical protein
VYFQPANHFARCVEPNCSRMRSPKSERFLDARICGKSHAAPLRIEKLNQHRAGRSHWKVKYNLKGMEYSSSLKLRLRSLKTRPALDYLG